jgi:hypothetical protein
MEYEGSIGLVSTKMIFFIADFHVFELFMAKKHDVSEKKIPSVTRLVRRNLCHAYSDPLKARKLKFWLPKSFRPT